MYKSCFLLWSSKQSWNVFKRNFTRKVKEKQNPEKENQSESKKDVYSQYWFPLPGHAATAWTGQIRAVQAVQGPQSPPCLASQSRVASNSIWGIISHPFSEPFPIGPP